MPKIKNNFENSYDFKRALTLESYEYDNVGAYATYTFPDFKDGMKVKLTNYVADPLMMAQELKAQCLVNGYTEDDGEVYVQLEAVYDTSDHHGEHVQSETFYDIPLREYMGCFSQWDWINFLAMVEYQKHVGIKMQEVFEAARNYSETQQLATDLPEWAEPVEKNDKYWGKPLHPTFENILNNFKP